TVGRVIQRIVLVPLDDAEVVIPVLGVQWWDVAADASRTATLPARRVRMQSAFVPAAPDLSPGVPRAIAAAFAMLLAVAVWWRVRKEPLRDARALLREACRKNDPRAARDALVQWWNAASPGATPRLLQTIGRGWDDAARAQLGALDAAVYGKHRWDGKEFWRRLRPWLRRRLSSRAATAPLRPAFFKLQATDASAA